MNNLFDRFTPKETKFFPLLSQMADVIENASKLMIECVRDYDPSTVEGLFKKIKQQERLGDKLQNQIFDELNKTFITPFDREDINNLSTTLDDVTDYINSCAKRMMLYKPKTMPDSAEKLAILINESSTYISKAIDELDVLKKNPARISEYCTKLAEIEHRADDVYENFLIDLFEKEKDAVEVIKLKDILHELERATDAAETVGKIIKTIIVKYA